MIPGNFDPAIGDVFYLRCTLCDPPKPKYFVVAHMDPLWMFIINTRRTDFAEARPPIVAASPWIRVADNPFLDHDSVIGCDCRPSHEYSLANLGAIFETNPGIYRGRLHADSRRAIVGALTNNRLVPQKYIKELLPAWQASIPQGAASEPMPSNSPPP